MNETKQKPWITRIMDNICATIVCMILVCTVAKRK